MPKPLGETQVDYPDYLDLVLNFVKADASTAWCINQSSVLGSLTCLVDEDTVKTIWNRSDISLVNSPPVGSCKNRETTEGYLLTSSWNSNSGISHADWLISIASTEMQDGTQSPMMHLLPKS